MATLVSDILSSVGDELKKTIGTSSSPTTAQCIRWMNRATEYILQNLIIQNHRLGRVIGAIASVAHQAAYTTYQDTLVGASQVGYILKTSSRPEIAQITEEAALGYGFATAEETEPEAFYIDGENKIVLCPTPDAVYAVKIPIWTRPTAMSATGSTVPFYNLMNDVYIQYLIAKSKGRDEYNIIDEMNWLLKLIAPAVAAIGNVRTAEPQLSVRM